MKNIFNKLLATVLALLMLNIQVTAGTKSNAIATNETSTAATPEDILSQVSELDALSEYISSNPEITYADVLLSSPNLVASVSPSASLPDSNGDDLMGIPPFLWGCALGWIGILLVYILTDSNKEQAKKALTGCIVSTATLVVIYVIYAAAMVVALSNSTPPPEYGGY